MSKITKNCKEKSPRLKLKSISAGGKKNQISIPKRVCLTKHPKLISQQDFCFLISNTHSQTLSLFSLSLSLSQLAHSGTINNTALNTGPKSPLLYWEERVTEFNSRTQGQKKGVNWLTQIKRPKN
jgi:hypothetical protein